MVSEPQRTKRAELNSDVMKAVESLKYRVTVGDVAARAGLDLATAEQGVLALASETQAHLQVSEEGEIAYEFPRNFRSALRSKYWQLRAKAFASKIWQVAFYLIRISFGIFLILSIALIFIAIFALMIAASAQGGGGNRDDRGGGGFGGFYISPFNIFYLFDFNYARGRRRYPNRRYAPNSYRNGRSAQQGEHLNFLEAIFSFLFGDGNPNADLEERRWRAIATVINNNGGAVVAEQIAPYLDDLGTESEQEYGDYMIPVMSRFNGRPQVSPDGEIVYYFPELQVSALDRGKASVSAYLREAKRKFTSATSDQVMLAIGLGAANIIGALVLQNMLGNAVVVGGFVGFVQSIFWLLMAYGIGFLAVPLIRYYWTLWRNGKIEARNEIRQSYAARLNRLMNTEAFKQKLNFARQFAQQKVLRADESVYSTETDLLEQEFDRADQIDAEFRRRLNEI